VEHFGKDLNWWATLIIVVAVLVVFDLIINMTKKRFWPSIVDVWQEIEEDRRSKQLQQED
jgi:ABC-type nitrate/sulfonate/bicarbonate transport system permease component